MKQGGSTVKNWRKRYFKLPSYSPWVLRWYESEKTYAAGKPKGEIECIAISGVVDGAALVVIYGRLHLKSTPPALLAPALK